MTRIIVKNLPNSATAEKLKETFSQKGQITDVQLKYDAAGKFRHFGFIGFKTDVEADAALNYFNNTYVGSCKIQVEKCVNLGDSTRMKKGNKPPPPAPNVKVEKQAGKSMKAAKAEEAPDPEFAEFLEVHSKKQAEKNIWGNDGIDGTAQNGITTTGLSSEEADSSNDKLAHKKGVSDLEYLKSKVVPGEGDDSKQLPAIIKKKEKEIVEYFTLKVRGFGCQAKKKDVRDFFSPLKPDSVRIPPKVKGVAYVGFASEREWNKALNKHRSFHAGHRISVAKYEKKSQPAVDSSKGKGKKEAWLQQENDIKKEESVAESGRIFIRNLPYSTNEEELEALFTPYGPLAETHLPVDKHSRKIKGFAFVTYVLPEHAVAAYTALDGSIFQGRMLHLIAGKSKPDEIDADGAEGGTNYKQKKLKEQKAQAGSAHNWNTLFLGTNAVATLMAERYGTTKQQVLLEGDGQQQQQSVAVRLALGETQLVAETKQFLVDNGIHLEVFDAAPKQRSKTTFLVKNLDAQATADELRELFSPFGELGRVLLPPRGVTAIVEFLEPSEARAAFRKLAYSKFRHMPLYLEWAPTNVFRTGPPSKPSSEAKVTGNDQSPTFVIDVKPSEGSSVENKEVEQPETETTLFVKNLNFDTTNETMRQHFETCGKIFSATVARKKDPKNPGKFLSMGYGFVQFFTKKATVAALKDLQNSTLDGHTIELKRSHRTDNTEETVATAKKSSSKSKEPVSSKLLIRNVPFEAKTKEVAELFKPFGELKAVRMPSKSVGTGSHRGFAFVEFLTKQDAKRAFESMSDSTHLYGRRLVLEWAANEDTVEDVRKRTTSHFADGPTVKRSKKPDGIFGSDMAPDSD